MKKKANQIDLVKMLFFILKHLWLLVLCAELGFGAFYMYMTRRMPETYTATGTMYVSSYNPEYIDDEYTRPGDLSSASQLIKTLLVVVKRDSVMSKVADRVSETHPGIDAGMVSSSLSMESVSETGVVAVKSTTLEAQLSADIANAVMEIAPEEIVRVVGVGNVDIMDYAVVPVLPNEKKAVFSSLKYGAAAGAAFAVVLLALLYILNQKITDLRELKENYKLPILAEIKRLDSAKKDPEAFLLTNRSPLEVSENYAKLRMNLFYTLVDKEQKIVVITSSVSGEGKSTISANLAISCAMSGNKVILVDSDMRRSSQSEIFKYETDKEGLSDVLAGRCQWQNVIMKDVAQKVDLLPAGHLPPNPAELLESARMQQLLLELNDAYDLVLLDMPPVDIVADPLAVSAHVAGCILIVRQHFTTHQDLRKALNAAEMTDMNVLGFVFYGEHMHESGYYSRKYYRKYYKNYYSKRTTRGSTLGSNLETARGSTLQTNQGSTQGSNLETTRGSTHINTQETENESADHRSVDK